MMIDDVDDDGGDRSGDITVKSMFSSPVGRLRSLAFGVLVP